MKSTLRSFQSTEALLGLMLLVGLAFTSRSSYLLFHSLVEIFSIVVAWSAFMVVWSARRFIGNGYLLFLGIAFLFIGALDLVHTLAYDGMGVFPNETANIPTQLWIAARYVQSLSFLAAPLLLNRKLRLSLVVGVYALATTVLLSMIWVWRIFPDCYIPGVGLTPFKIASEYIICVLLGGALVWLYRQRATFDPNVAQLLLLSIVASIASELAFTSYVSVYDGANLIGHLFKIVAFFLIYKAIVETGVVKPYDLVFRDLKQSETALRAANKQLEKEVSERRRAEQEISKLNAALEKHASELEAANHELEAFAYSISHDLRAPLHSIAEFSRLLLSDNDPQMSPDSQRLVQLVSQNAESMNALVNGLLNFSRTSRQPLKKETVLPDKIVDQVLEELSGECKGRKIEIVRSKLPECRADPLLLKQVYVNLLTNALKFTRAREVAKIEIGSYSHRLPLTKGEGEGVTYFVRDNGVGFDAEHADKLFGVFQRLHHQEDYEGTGVGLAIVERIVRRHGGRVWAESKENQGAAFYFTLLE